MKKILEKLLGGLSDANIKFSDLRKLILSFNFTERIKGGHHIFEKRGIIKIIKIQSKKDGKAKRYQVKRVKPNIKYKLHSEKKDDKI